MLDFLLVAWLAQLDARTVGWPKPACWLYLAVKWSLVAIGAIAWVRVSLDKTGVWPFFH